MTQRGQYFFTYREHSCWQRNCWRLSRLGFHMEEACLLTADLYSYFLKFSSPSNESQVIYHHHSKIQFQHMILPSMVYKYRVFTHHSDIYWTTVGILWESIILVGTVTISSVSHSVRNMPPALAERFSAQQPDSLCAPCM